MCAAGLYLSGVSHTMFHEHTQLYQCKQTSEGGVTLGLGYRLYLSSRTKPQSFALCKLSAPR